VRPDELDDEIRRTVKRGRRKPLFSGGEPVDLGRSAVELLLPHRDPFLFVDRITAVDLEGETITGTRRIDPDDPIFAGHFPGQPIYPGVLQLETMGQLGICLSWFLRQGDLALPSEPQPLQVRALKIHATTFLAEVKPGDELTILARQLIDDGTTAVSAGQLLVDGRPAAVAVMEMLHVD